MTHEPHTPYIAAVADALGPRAVLDHTDYAQDDGEVMLLEAYIRVVLDDDETDVLGVLWDQTRGWEYGWERADSELRHRVELDVPLLAYPAEVADAVAALVPRLAAVIPTHPATARPAGPATLPPSVQLALDGGDIDRETADHLAAYWITAGATV